MLHKITFLDASTSIYNLLNRFRNCVSGVYVLKDQKISIFAMIELRSSYMYNNGYIPVKTNP